MKSRTVRFTVSEEMVQAFARLTGDRSSLHLDEEMARRSRFRRRIAHGMLPVCFLQLLGRDFPGRSLRFERLKVRFEQPVHPGDELELELSLPEVPGPAPEFAASFRKLRTGERVTRASGRLRLGEPGEAGPVGAPEAAGGAEGPAPCLAAGPLVERDCGIEELRGASVELPFALAGRAAAALAREILSAAEGGEQAGAAPCPNLLGALMLSPLVGMRLPGRRATFLGFQLAFERDLAPGGGYALRAGVERASEAAETLGASVAILSGESALATGSVEVLVNAAPRAMPSCAEIRARHLDLGLRGAVSIVTGASRGIGETTAKLLAMHGAKVVLTYHRGRRDAERVAAEIRAEGGEALPLRCDVRSDEDVRALVRGALDAFGTVDVLVNNAVQEFTPRALPELRWEDYLEELEVSLKGLHACCREVVPVFKQKRRGKIVNLSTVAVDNPVSGQSRYITAKSAVVGFTKSLAIELLPWNVQANVVVPSLTETDLVAGIPAAYRARLAEARASKRHVQPIEVAQAVAFAASRWADAISGQQIVLNLGEPPFA
jgi:NAD(P)-dependent dehydrogenase (short-subunit alcohol dehydrogenase family)/acyl dehydratase